MLWGDRLIECERGSHVIGSLKWSSDNVESQTIDACFFTILGGSYHLLVGHLSTEHFCAVFFVSAFNAEPNGVAARFRGALAEFLVHNFNARVD